MLGEHSLVHKGPYCYEGVVRIPTILKWPGRIAPGSTSAALVEGVDFMPTLHYDQYVSCSKDTSTFGFHQPARNKIRLTIQGQSGKDIQAYSKHPAEQEVLFGRETIFQVKEKTLRDDGGYDIILQERSKGHG